MEGDVEEGEDGSLGLEKRAAWGLGRAPGVSRKETLAPTCSKKAGRLKGCFLVSYVFLRVTFRSQGLSTDSWGSKVQREAWSFPRDSGLLIAPWTESPVLLMFVESLRLEAVGSEPPWG